MFSAGANRGKVIDRVNDAFLSVYRFAVVINQSSVIQNFFSEDG